MISKPFRSKALLERLHDGCNIFALRFADEKVYVLRHHDVPDTDEVIAAPDLFEGREEEVALVGTGQKRLPVIATGGNEVHVSGTVAAIESGGHTLFLAVCREECL